MKDPLHYLDPSIVVFKVDELASILKCDPATVRRMCRARVLNAIKLQREWRIPRWSLTNYLLAQSVDPDAAVDVCPAHREESRHG